MVNDVTALSARLGDAVSVSEGMDALGVLLVTGRD
jgi:hypothetical protein